MDAVARRATDMLVKKDLILFNSKSKSSQKKLY